MWYFLLTCTLIILAIFFYFVFKKDIISPTILSCLIYALSSFSALLARKEGSWNFQDLHFETFKIVVIGILSFGIAEYFARKFAFKSKKKQIDLSKFEYQIIRVNVMKVFLCYVFTLLTMILIYINMKNVTGQSGIMNVIHNYRMLSPIFNPSAIEDGIKINTLYMQMFRACEIIAVIYIYIIVTNMLAKDKFSKNFVYLVLVIICILLSFLLSGRVGLVKYLIIFFILWFILYSRKKRLNIAKFVKVSVRALIIILPIFYFILPLLGRTTDANLYDYLTFYLGCPLPSFDVMLENGIVHSLEFGELTMKGPQAILNKLGLIEQYSQYSSNWIWFSRGLSSNVFTSLYAPFVDFGLNGVIICQFCFGLIFSKLYLWGKKFSNCVYLLFFVFYVNQIIDQFRTEKLFTNIIHYNTIIYLILLIILVWFILGKKKMQYGGQDE